MSSKSNGFAATRDLWDGLGFASVIIAFVWGMTQCSKCETDRARAAWELERDQRQWNQEHKP